MRVNFGKPLGADTFLYLLGELRQVILTDRPALAGFTHTRGDFSAVERLGNPGAFNNRNTGCFDRGKPAPAVGTLATAADCGTVIGGAGVNHSGIGVFAVGAIHREPPRSDGV